MPLPVARNTEHGGYYDPYTADKDRRGKNLKQWWQSLPVSQQPIATSQCMGILIAIQVVIIIVFVILLSTWGRVTNVVTLEKYGHNGLSRTLASVAMFIRKNPQGELEVRLQNYSPKTSACVDPQFESRTELFAARVGLDENPFAAIKREMTKRMLLTDSDIKSMSVLGMNDGSMSHLWTVESENQVFASADRFMVLHDPLIYVQSLRGTKPWNALGFPVLVPYEVSKKMTMEGSRWESAGKLHRHALSTPSDFAGLHYPFVLRFTGDMVSGVLNPERDDKMQGVIGSFTEYRGDGEFQTSKDPDFQDKVLSDVNVWSRSAGEDVGRVLNATERVMANRLRNRAGAGKQ